MHQAMARALVKAQRRATAPQSTGRGREKRPCTDIVPHTAPQSAVPMDNGATGAVGARSMIAALQKAANRNARGGSRKVPASTQAPATARIQPAVRNTFMPDVMHSIAKVFVACRNAWILANGDGCSVVHCQAQAAP